jgi:exopolyphosphatase/guanosine-5'-triphosphate,3'-diphosphate pyrophosphatase
LLVASYSQGQLKVIDRIREMVRLAAGLDAHDCLDEAGQVRALECLARFGERLRDIPPDRLRVVGTNTLRKAKNPAEFVGNAEDLLGHEIDIISGIEEARLIYIGASRSMPAVEGDQLFVDIGGGSTELAAGRGFQPRVLESLSLGCVAMSRRYFSGGEITAEGFAQARTAARLELRPVAERFRCQSWERVAGASGTIRAAGKVLEELGYTEQAITIPALEKVILILLGNGHVDEVSFSSIPAERMPVFPGGLAILVEVMQALGIAELMVSQGALREGLLFDLIGRSSEEDARIRTVRAMEQRYHVDENQANRVEQSALVLYEEVADNWGLNQPTFRQMLRWAARLHEVGLDIAHAHYHRHGAYLLEHSDMPGFNRSEQLLLATIVKAHRRKFLTVEDAAVLPKGWPERVLYLAIILRLAVLFNRSRTHEFPDLLNLVAHGRVLTVQISSDWLAANPLTLADLEQEQEYLLAADWELQLVVV